LACVSIVFLIPYIHLYLNTGILQFAFSSDNEIDGCCLEPFVLILFQAVQNTRLLARYASIDMRCKVLGFALKLLTKRCGIADSYNHYLSSYTYTLMVVYYLQQLRVPVLPALQQVSVSFIGHL